MKLRKMLGSIEDESCIKLMRLIETQSNKTLGLWAINYIELNIIPILIKYYDCSKVSDSINVVKSYLKGEIKLKEVKLVLKDLRELLKETNDNVVTQTALRTIVTACGVVTTPTNALGFTFYALAALIYDQFGLDCDSTFYDIKASEYYRDILKSLEEVAVSNEENPVKVNWYC